MMLSRYDRDIDVIIYFKFNLDSPILGRLIYRIDFHLGLFTPYYGMI